jgi:cytochrome c oxidase subunit IV
MTPETATTKPYFLVFAALLALTLLTTGVAYINLGPFSAAVALTIAVIKASLVMIFFMHLVHSSFLPRVFAGAGILWLLHLLIFTLSDYLTR